MEMIFQGIIKQDGVSEKEKIDTEARWELQIELNGQVVCTTYVAVNEDEFRADELLHYRIDNKILFKVNI